MSFFTAQTKARLQTQTDANIEHFRQVLKKQQQLQPKIVISDQNQQTLKTRQDFDTN